MNFSRLLLLLAVLAALVLLPFAIWGQEFDTAVPTLVVGQTTLWSIAVFGIGLLVLDVVLPIPSSVVAISLCFLLGPIWGGVAVFVGTVGAFAVGYLLGMLLPSERLRSWLGMKDWESLWSGTVPNAVIWLAILRPVPVASEASAILAGALRLPLPLSLVSVVASSALVAAAYGFAAKVGLDNQALHLTVFVIAAAALPAMLFTRYVWLPRKKVGGSCPLSEVRCDGNVTELTGRPQAPQIGGTV